VVAAYSGLVPIEYEVRRIGGGKSERCVQVGGADDPEQASKADCEPLSYSKPSGKRSQCLKYGIGASKERRSLLWKKDLSKYRI
jgi:hypothetical protein